MKQVGELGELGERFPVVGPLELSAGLAVRAALGDTPRSARYIRTVPRFGYAFHGDARQALAGGATTSRVSRARLASGAREWWLSEGPNLVGRDHDCSVRIESPTLSRYHARIVVTSEGATIEDLGSKNGTRVEIVGEATRRLPASLREQYPHVPWQDMAGMRDKIIHGYDNVNLRIVWDVVKRDIPEGRPLIQQLFRDLES